MWESPQRTLLLQSSPHELFSDPSTALALSITPEQRKQTFLHVYREHKDAGIGYAPNSFEPAFLLLNCIFVTNINEYLLAVGFPHTF